LGNSYFDNVHEIDELRRVMGTLPNQNPKLETKFIRGVEGISVELIDYNVNPYKAMYVLATSCWGDKINKWEETSPEHRFLVVKAVLENQALPLALECPNFTFAVEGPSRAAFDQIARTRIGAVFSAKGMRDNNWKGASVRVPTALWPDQEDFDLYHEYRKFERSFTPNEMVIVNKVENFIQIKEDMENVKMTYANIVDQGMGSWQAARTVLPLYVVYGYSVNYNFASLRNVCANRMKFCEMEDTVAVAWLMAKEVRKQFPFLGSYLRPGCDFAGRCQYHKSYSLSELFGCLFKECGRNPCPDSNDYAEFNETCTNYNDLEEQLGIKIDKPDEWPIYNHFYELSYQDKSLFVEAE
jgi:thymidylate synthase ThyX